MYRGVTGTLTAGRYYIIIVVYVFYCFYRLVLYHTMLSSKSLRITRAATIGYCSVTASVM